MLPRKNFENLLAVMAILVLFKFSGRFYLNFLTLLVSARQICFVRTRAVDLGGPSVYQGGLKFEIKHKSHCFQKSKLVEGGGRGPGPPLAPALVRTFSIMRVKAQGYCYHKDSKL